MADAHPVELRIPSKWVQHSEDN